MPRAYTGAALKSMSEEQVTSMSCCIPLHRCGEDFLVIQGKGIHANLQSDINCGSEVNYGKVVSVSASGSARQAH